MVSGKVCHLPESAYTQHSCKWSIWPLTRYIPVNFSTGKICPLIFCVFNGKPFVSKWQILPLGRYMLHNAILSYRIASTGFCIAANTKTADRASVSIGGASPCTPNPYTTQGGINYQKANHSNQHSSDGKGKTADTAAGRQVRSEPV